MGSDKALVPLCGRPLIRWAFDALEPLGDIIVVARTPPDRSLFPGPGARFVQDLYPGAGPLAGVHAALSALNPGEECVVVSTCDMPFVFFELLRALAERVLGPRSPAAAAWVDAQGRSQHFPAAFHRRALPVVEEALASGDRSMRGLLERLRAEFLDVGEVAPRKSARAQFASFNVNTPEDLNEARAIATRLSGAVCPD